MTTELDVLRGNSPLEPRGQPQSTGGEGSHRGNFWDEAISRSRARERAEEGEATTPLSKNGGIGRTKGQTGNDNEDSLRGSFESDPNREGGDDEEGLKRELWWLQSEDEASPTREGELRDRDGGGGSVGMQQRTSSSGGGADEDEEMEWHLLRGGYETGRSSTTCKPVHRIMMVSDFFYPDAGGVENHQYMLSQCLLEQGHKVVVVTRARGSRIGVRWLTNGLKTYYLPFQSMPDVFSSGKVMLPSLLSGFPIIRHICIRERITIGRI